MNHSNNTIIINANSKSVKGNLTVSGQLNRSGFVLGKCEEVLEDYEKGKIKQALQNFKSLLEKYPNSISVNRLKVLLLYRNKKYKEAYKEIKKTLKLTPKNSSALNMRGLIQRKLNLFDEAIYSYRLAIQIKPDFAEPYNNLAIIYRYYGEKDLAVKNFRKAIAINESYCSAFYNLSVVSSYNFTKKEKSKLKNLLPNLKNVKDIIRCHFSLYNVYLKDAKYKEAFYHLNQGNSLEFLNYKNKRSLKEYVKEAKQNFDLNYLKQSHKLEPFNKSPFFIVGMPRSGSSLLEQILSLHSSVQGLGETQAIPDMLVSINPYVDVKFKTFFDGFNKLNEQQLSKKLNIYKKKIIEETKGFEVYTDKMLKNFKTLGFIKILLPNAKFIHMKRNAIDNCLSCYEKKFTNGHEYASDLKYLANYYSAYLELVEYWKSLFPSDIHEVNYEDLIYDSEKVVKQCFEFMSLKMDMKTLEYYKSKRAVFTASTEQVREKISNRSIGKWKKFEKELQPLIQELEKNKVSLV